MQYVFVNNDNAQNLGLEINDVGFIKEEKNDSSYLIIFLRKNEGIVIDKLYVTKFDISKTGDSYEYKVCDRCFKRLPTDKSFSNNRHKKDNFITKRPSCKQCRKIKDGKPVSKADRNLWDFKKPKLYQPFTCPICNKTTIVGISKIVLDHNHNTGDVRGFLCESCNTGIGRFDDTPEIVQKALDWLNASD